MAADGFLYEIISEPTNKAILDFQKLCYRRVARAK